MLPSQTVTFKLDGSLLATSPATVQTDTSGNLPTISFTVPSIAAGVHTVTATDTSGDVATATFSLLAKISITPTTGTVGTQITVTGSGFVLNGPVSIYWDAGASPIASTTSSSTGTISIAFNAPASAAGTHTIKVADTSNNSATAQFSTSAKIVLSPATGSYNGKITITFSGFTANSTVTSTQIISGSTAYNLATTPTTVQTDANGSATATFAVPDVPNGSWTVQSTDSGSASAQATLSVTATISLSASTGAAGDQVTIMGYGFAANKTITVKYGTLVLTFNSGSVGTTGADGAFGVLVTVPPTPAGAIVLTASDGTNSATANFTASAKATITPVTSQGSPGLRGFGHNYQRQRLSA